jgi:hypothetical protein
MQSKVASFNRRPCTCWVSSLLPNIISLCSPTTQNVRITSVQNCHSRTSVEFAASGAELDLLRISHCPSKASVKLLLWASVEGFHIHCCLRSDGHWSWKA